MTRSDLSRILSDLPEFVHMPAGMGWLRAKVVEAAMSGHLVTAPSDGSSADDLLDEIRGDKSRMKLKGGVRLVDPSDNAYDIPDHWRLVELGDILSHCRNGTSVSPNADGDGYRILRISAGTSHKDGFVDLADYKYAAMSGADADPYLIQPGDLLACRFNGNLRYVGRVAQVPNTVEIPTLHPDKLICLRAFRLSHDYLRHALNSAPVRRQIEDVAATTAGNIGINGRQVKALVIPIPPMTEQVRIAAQLDELFVLLDQLESQLKHEEDAREQLRSVALNELGSSKSQLALEILSELVQSVPDSIDLERALLSLVTSGKLTPVSGDPHAATALLDELTVSGVTPKLGWPYPWPAARLGDMAEVRLGRQRSPGRAFGERMRPYLRAANVTWGGIDTADVKEMAFTEAESATFELRYGDLLLSEASGSPTEVGKPAQFRDEVEDCCFQNTLIRVRLKAPLNPDYYEWYFRHQAMSGKFADTSRGLGIQHLGAKTLANWITPVPPIVEQAAIVERLTELMTLVDALRRQLAA